MTIPRIYENLLVTLNSTNESRKIKIVPQLLHTDLYIRENQQAGIPVEFWFSVNMTGNLDFIFCVTDATQGQPWSRVIRLRPVLAAAHANINMRPRHRFVNIVPPFYTSSTAQLEASQLEYQAEFLVVNVKYYSSIGFDHVTFFARPDHLNVISRLPAIRDLVKKKQLRIVKMDLLAEPVCAFCFHFQTYSLFSICGAAKLVQTEPGTCLSDTAFMSLLPLFSGKCSSI